MDLLRFFRRGKKAVRWIQPGDSTIVAGRNIGGMVYLGPDPYRDSRDLGGNEIIDPNLPIAKTGADISGDTMPYWPRYSNIAPRARVAYLDWLATGRSDTRYGTGYVFLYFYGLERRFFMETPGEEEKYTLIAETERLLRVYGGNSSVQRYLRTFLVAAQATLIPVDETVPSLEQSGYELPLDLRISIGRKVKESLPLNADCLLAWYVAHPEGWLRTPAKRAFPEFRALFAILFDERFPEGLKIQTPRRVLSARYTAASGAFEIDLNRFFGNLPDISGLSKPLKVAKTVVEEATAALDKYSRFLGRNPQGRNTIEAHALLPESLWPLFPCAGVENLRHWVEEIINNGGFSPVEQVIGRLEGATPKKIGKRQLTDAGDALARLSIGMAPDPRFALRSPKFGEPVVLFRLPEGTTELKEVSEKYKVILVNITIGSFVARADGTISAMERNAIESMINIADLSLAERSRLHANFQWMMTVPPDLALFRRQLRGIPEKDLHAFGQIALAMAATDGVIYPGEIKIIERLYKAMDLSTDGVYSALHALTSRSEPVIVRTAGEEELAFAIPSPPNRDRKVILDAKLVAEVMANTAHVSSILGDIFQDDEPEETPEDDRGVFPGLDARYATFLNELLTRAHWEENEFTILARQFHMMPAGALETVNEWAFDSFGDQLIEEYEGYNINPDVAVACRN